MYRALIVDDEKIIADGIKSLLPWEELGFSEVHAECDPEHALRLALQNPPDLIITDIRMPKLDGVKLLGEIRGKNIDSMAIVLSGHNDFEYVRAMALLGIEDYLLKPVNEEKLMQVTQRVFDKLELRAQKRLHMQMTDKVFRDNIVKRWVHGTIDEAELSEKAALCQLRCDAEGFLPCLMMIDPGQRGPLAKYEIARALTRAARKRPSLRVRAWRRRGFDRRRVWRQRARFAAARTGGAGRAVAKRRDPRAVRAAGVRVHGCFAQLPSRRR